MTQNFPLHDMAYDVIAVLYQKSKALEVYEQYMQDADSDKEVKDLLSQISQQDRD